MFETLSQILLGSVSAFGISRCELFHHKATSKNAVSTKHNILDFWRRFNGYCKRLFSGNLFCGLSYMQTNHFALSQDTETYVTWLSQAKGRSVKVGRAKDCRMYVNFLTTSCFDPLSPNSYKGEYGWRSGESTRLPPMWPGFDSRSRWHMWVEFVLGSRPCSEGFSPGTPVFLPP